VRKESGVILSSFSPSIMTIIITGGSMRKIGRTGAESAASQFARVESRGMVAVLRPLVSIDALPSRSKK
jgi:hypothetical protein